MKKLLVVGAGYVGEEIVRRFSDTFWEVTPATLSGGEASIPLDVSDAEAVANLPDYDAIIHCAASGRGGPDAYKKVYLDGCRNLTRRFPKARIVFTSSSSVYAQVDGELVTENSATEPSRETGQILLNAEREVLSKGGAVVRLAGIYGPQRSVLLRKFLNGEAVIEDDGRRTINQIHRDDAAGAIYHLFHRESFPHGEIFNVCDSTPMSQKQVYQGLAERFGKDLPPYGPKNENKKRGWTHKQVSNAKIRSTGWEPIYPSFFDALDTI